MANEKTAAAAAAQTAGSDSLPHLNEELAKASRDLEQLTRENKELRQKLLEAGRQDQLTGLYNRRTMLERLKEEFFRAGRYHYFLSVLVLDLDHFKQVNDQFGQDRGDEVIRIVSGLLTETAREGDTVARIGDQLLAVVLPYTSKADCNSFGDRLRKRISGLYNHPSHRESIPCALTASVGCASTEAGIGDEEMLLQRAEDMMLQCKANGGNQTRVFELEEEV